MKDRLHMPPGHMRGPRGGNFDGPWPGGPGPFSIAHAVFPWLFLLLFAALVTVAIIALVRFSKTTPRTGAPPNLPIGGGYESDPALQALRGRYARGEIDRDEYLQAAADLGERKPMPPPAS